MSRPKTLSDEVEAEIMKQRGEGKTLRALATTFGLTAMGIMKLLRRKESVRANFVIPTFLTPHSKTISLHQAPPIVAVVDNLAILVIDQDQWDVHAIERRFSIPHAVAWRYLQNATTQATKLGLKLLCLWKNELSSPALEKMVLHKTSQQERLCSAREVEVVVVDKDQANVFYTQNHLQGPCNAPICLGLTFKDQLVSCMSFNKTTACRGTAEGHLLQRFAVAGSIPGAAGKLLSAFRKTNTGQILSYSDERYAPGGGLYKALGFQETGLQKPDYRYWRDNRWYAKNTKQRKHLIKELGCDPLPDDTEFSMATRLGYKRCYDAGKRTWLLP